MKILLKTLKENKNLKLTEKIENISFIEDQDLLTLQIDFDVQIYLENLVLVNGFFTALLHKHCERCLEEFDCKIKVEFSKDYEIESNQKEIDLSEDIREEFWLNIPLVYICNENCKGLCQICGTNLNIKICDCKNKEFNNNPLSDLNKLIN
jgi:uncharacterized protein